MTCGPLQAHDETDKDSLNDIKTNQRDNAMSTLPPFNFALGDDLDALRDMVAAWADEKLAPLAEQIDHTNTFPKH